MGTGLTPLGNAILKEKSPPKSAHIFISHYHWDHMYGYLGFAPFFQDSFVCHIYGKKDKMSIDEIFKYLHNYTFWPVDTPMYQAKINLDIFPKSGVQISDSITITAIRHTHPNGANSYRLEIDGHVIVYCTDIEHPEGRLSQNVIDFAKDADVFINDAHFTDKELPAHKGWGHSSWQQAVAIADKANVKQLVLFHHSPSRDDAGVSRIEKDAQAVFKNTIAAREGMEISLPA